ncbi:MBL fold metallo-hydrolase [Kineosporiaceae bacterium SCSIO 59966]|nr:MBL fold metallo-hydrolase [Kineosporiaceae bacterium SCSIO 59966]
MTSAAGPDLRLLPAAASAWAAAGWAVGARPGPVLLAACGTGLAVAVIARWWRARGAGGWLVAGAAVVVVLSSVLVHGAVRTAGPLPALVEQRAAVSVDGLVLEAPRPVRADPARPDDPPRYVVRLLVTAVDGRGQRSAGRSPVLVIGPAAWASPRPHETVRATGRLAPADPGDDVVALLLAATGPQVVSAAPTWARAAESLREGLRRAAAPLPPDAGGLLPGLVVGDTSTLPPDLEEDMRATGLSHLTAVSGANTTIVSGAVLLAAAAAGAGRRLRLALAGGALAGFVALAGPEPSVLRAAVMGAVGLAGLAAARRGRGVPLLSGAVVALCVIDPWLSRSFGFALSVLATGALLLLARPMAAALSRVLPSVAAHAVAVPASAQAVCGPVVVLLTPHVPLLSVPANLLVAPAVAPATVLGVLATVLAPLSPQAAELVARVAGVATGWIGGVARAAAGLPGATLPWPAGVTGAVLLAVVTVAGLLLAAAVLRLPRPLLVGGLAGALAGVLVGVLVAVPLVVLPGALRGLRGPAWPPPGWLTVACDVGQGSALVTRSGPSSAVLVDAGPDPAAVDRCLEDLGVDSLDLVVLSHFHADHVAGLAGALDGRSVGQVVTSPLAEPADGVRQVQRVLGNHGVPAVPGGAGMAGTAGQVRWRVLWPAGPPGDAAPGDAASGEGSSGEGSSDGSRVNDASLVVLLDVQDRTVLATGDVEPAAQQGLHRALPAGTRPDVVTVPHHGSAAQDDDLARALSPRVALVSAGAGNDYGHPTQRALDLYRSTGALVLRTDESGDVAVGSTEGRLWTVGRAGAVPSAGRGRLAPWQDDGRPVARPRRSAGGRSLPRRSSSSPGPRSSSPSGRWTRSASSPAATSPTSRWSTSTPPSTRRTSSPPGRAPPSSASHAWSAWWASSRPPMPSSRTPSPTSTTCRTTSCCCCATPAGSGDASSSRRCGPPRRRWSSTAPRSRPPTGWTSLPPSCGSPAAGSTPKRCGLSWTPSAATCASWRPAAHSSLPTSRPPGPSRSPTSTGTTAGARRSPASRSPTWWSPASVSTRCCSCVRHLTPARTRSRCSPPWRPRCERW